ncbi:MAG: FG-GAP repeat domain-containing protein [Candidatus Thorarchaeota archaeon]
MFRLQKKYYLISGVVIFLVSTGLITAYLLGAFEESSKFSFSKITLNGPDHATTISYIDLDGDDDIDILGAAGSDNIFCWWENIGEDMFLYHIISNSFYHARILEGTDLDLDGDMDLVGSTFDMNQLIAFINNGTETFSHQIITSSFHGGYGIEFADLNRDNYSDIVACAYYDNKVCWFENNRNLTFTERIVTLNLGEPTQSHPVDIDSDGDIDILAMGNTPGEIRLCVNNGTQSFQDQVIHLVPEMVHGASAADIDDDGDLDIVGCTITGSGSIYWFEALGSNNFELHSITNDFEGVNYVMSQDFDLDGDADVIASSFDCEEISVWENLGEGVFRKHIAVKFPAAYFKIVDIDGDNDLDFLSVTHHPPESALFKNIS